MDTIRGGTYIKDVIFQHNFNGMILDSCVRMEMLKCTKTESAESPVCDSKHRVLVVDDDPAVLFAYCRLIEREGIAVDVCECLNEALKNIKSTPYLAVVTDLRLAGTENTDGLDVIRALRQVDPHTAFILATGHGSRDIELKVRDLGATHYFEKPVMPSSILVLLNDLKAAHHSRQMSRSAGEIL